MIKLLLAKKMKGIRGGKGAPYTLQYEIPEWEITFPEGGELAKAAADEMRDKFKRDIGRGIDAEGKQWTIADSTAKRRRYDTHPPSSPKVTLKELKSGTVSIKLGDRFAKRFRGSASKGGTVAFFDSGNLVNGIETLLEKTSQNIGVAKISVPGNRAVFVNAAEKGTIPRGGRKKDGTYPHGFLPPMPLFAIHDKILDSVLNRAASMASGENSNLFAFGEKIGGLAAIALFAGVGVLSGQVEIPGS